MGKHKRQRDNDIDELYRKVKKLKKDMKRKKKHREESPSISDVSENPNQGEMDLTETQKTIEDQEPDLTEEQQTSKEPDNECLIVDDNTNENEVLGEDPTKITKYGNEIDIAITSRWEHICKEGLNKETKAELLKSFILPQNCRFLEAPNINAEVKAALSDSVQKRDKVLTAQQNLLGQATAGIAVALNSMIKERNTNSLDTTKTISNVGRILCELFHVQSSARRSLIQYALNKENRDIVSQTKIENHLFGDNLADILKAGKAINKTGSEIKYSKPPPAKPNAKNNGTPLNYRGPPRRQQQRRPPAPGAGKTVNTKIPTYKPRLSNQKMRSHRDRK